MQFCPLTCCLSFTRPSQNSCLVFSFRVRDQISHSQKTPHTIIVLYILIVGLVNRAIGKTGTACGEKSITRTGLHNIIE
jgi:hypothetical protein